MAFGRLEVLEEATAKAAITARSIGDPVTTSDAAVGQLTELLAARRNRPHLSSAGPLRWTEVKASRPTALLRPGDERANRAPDLGDLQ